MHTRNINQLLLWVLFIAILVVKQPQLTWAQPTGEQPVYTASLLFNIAWSNDGQKLTFQERPSTPSTFYPDGWLDYNVATQQITVQDTWPLQPSLSASEKQLYQVASNENGHDSFIISSPDGRYLTYASTAILSTGRQAMAIADTLTQNVITTPLESIGAFSGPDNFSTYWSDNQQVFVLDYTTLLTNEHLFFFVSDYDFASNSLTSEEIETEINGFRRFPDEVYDVASNNHYVLMSFEGSGLTVLDF